MLKIWALRHSLRFPSFVQEQALFRAAKPGRRISESFFDLLRFLAAQFNHEPLTQQDQDRIAQAARTSQAASTWPEIL